MGHGVGHYYDLMSMQVKLYYFSLVPQTALVTIMLTIIGSSAISASVSAVAVCIVIKVRRSNKQRKDQLAAAKIAIALQSATPEVANQPAYIAPQDTLLYSEIIGDPIPPPLPPGHPCFQTKANKAYGFRRKA